MNKKFGSVKIIKRKKKLPIDAGLKFLASKESNLYNIAKNEDRYQCFLKKGVICKSCGLEASYFAIELVSSKSYSGYSLNLYGLKNSREQYFTKDHIKPKSLGGKDSIENYQTMCWPCNSRKGSNLI